VYSIINYAVIINCDGGGFAMAATAATTTTTTTTITAIH
jgi:hypothetical protein